jgi:hypothetical protein
MKYKTLNIHVLLTFCEEMESAHEVLMLDTEII